MPRFESGVRYYTYAKATVHFPEDKVCCELCPMLETYSRKQCRLTGEYLGDTRTIGFACPLDFIENDNERNERKNEE